ncbi:MAG: hypothetical protein WD691_03060 [Acidimicrobiales bacterium]
MTGGAVLAAMAAAVGLLSVLVVGLLRSHAEILRALHQLGVDLDADAPVRPVRTGRQSHRPAHPGADQLSGRGAFDVAGDLPAGGAAQVAIAGVSHRTLVAFLSTGCTTCGVFWEELDHMSELDLAGDPVRVVIVTAGTDAESPSAVAKLAPSDVVTVMSSDAWEAYDVPVSPYFVLVDGPSSRVIGEGAGTSLAQVLELLGRAMADTATTGPTRRRARGADRADRVDAELRQAGLHPGDPSLYPPTDDGSE